MENYGRLDPETGLSTRLADFLRSFDQVVDFALENQVDVFLFAGDAYKTREPAPTYQREFAKRILKLSQSSIPVVLLIGNHDTPNAYGKATTLDIYATLELPNVYVLRQPEISSIQTKSGVLHVVGLPWLQKKEFETVGEILPSLYEKVDNSGVTIAMAHASVEGSVYGSERIVSLGGDYVLPKALLLHSKLAYVALGHIHKRQVLHHHPPIVYPGSLERVDFGEEKEPKSFEFIEIDEKSARPIAKHQPIIVKAREFLTINTTVSPDSVNPTKDILTEVAQHDLKNKIVRLIINLSPENNDLDMEQIKKSLADSFFLAGISRNVTRSIRTSLVESALVEQLTPLQVLEKYFEGKKYSASKIELLKKVAREMIEEGQ
jgi:exonuclease SbcD